MTDYITRAELLDAIKAVLDSLTNTQRTGVLDRQLTIIESLAARVEILDLEQLHRECTPNAPLVPEASAKPLGR